MNKLHLVRASKSALLLGKSRLVISNLFLLIFFGYQSQANADTIGFFYALDQDFRELIIAAKGHVESESIGDVKVSTVNIGPHLVVAVKMGAGNVCTAQSVQATLSRYPCSLIVSVGPTGAISGGFEIGEWVIIENVVCYQIGTEGPLGFLSNKVVLSSDKWRELHAVLPLLFRKPYGETIASGETFYASNSAREKLAQVTGSSFVDMNMFGLAEVAQKNSTPWLAFKIVSDYADDNAGIAFAEFIRNYKGQGGGGGGAVANLIQNLPSAPETIGAHKNLRTLMGN